MRRIGYFGGALVAALIAPATAGATDYTYGPGDTLTLTANLELQPGDNFIAQGTVDNPCVVAGGGFTITAIYGWAGTFTMSNCQVSMLGTASTAALEITQGGTNTFTLQGTTFDASGYIHVTAGPSAQVQIIGNTILATTLVPVVMTSLADSVAAITLDGYGNSNMKLFQGNLILRSFVHMQSTGGWLFGGDNPGEGNIISGQRGGIFIENGTDIRVVGNYLHVLGPLDGWNQVKNFSAGGSGILVEHNVMRGGNWLLDIGADIEIRYNLFADSYDRPWLLLEEGDANENIHHNIFTRTDPNVDEVSGVWVLRAQGTNPAQLYNNTFYGGGKCWQAVAEAIGIEPGAFLQSLRSNAIVQFPVSLGSDTALVRGGGPEGTSNAAYEPNDPPPPRLGYADYNLFYNPDAYLKINYAVSVAGLTERVDPGFALNDQAVGGTVDQQVDPQFTGPIPIAFPYSEDDIEAGTTTVCQILHLYRQLFTPAAGSPLIDSGDPQEGAGNDIGAIGAGTANALDLFGTLCAGDDVGTPDLSAASFQCPALPTKPGNPNTPVTAPPGFLCVCTATGGPAPASFITFVSGLAIVLGLRRRRPRRTGSIPKI